MTIRDRIIFPIVKTLELGMKYVASDWYERNGYPQIAKMLGAGSRTSSGKSVSEGTALTCSTVWACNRVIAETVGSLPLTLMQDRNGEKVERPDLPLYDVLKYEPNPEMDALHFRESRTSHCVLRGNAYARIARRLDGSVVGLWPIAPDAVRIERNSSDELVYFVRGKNSVEQKYAASEIFHLPGLGEDGISGVSVVALAKESIGLALTQEEYVAKYFARGGRRPYQLEHPQKFKTDEDFKLFRQRWNEMHGTQDTWHNPPILEAGMKLTELGFSPQDAQFLESRQFSVPEICRWFRISPHLVGDLSRATFSNIEHLAIEFVQQTLMVWLNRWEQAIRRQLLTPKEKQQRLYVKHNVNALLRGDFQSRMSGFATALQNGYMCPNEVRALEDMNPFNGGDDYHIQLNMQTLGGGEATASQTAAIQKLGTRKEVSFVSH